jgi:iron complex transport system substrate-binding protein
MPNNSLYSPQGSSHNRRKFFFFFILCMSMLVLPIFYRLANAEEITDQAGKTVHFDHPFKRIISLYGAHTENLAAMGLDKEIIGRAASDDYPPSITSKPEFSDLDDPEKFLAAKPDLILVRPMLEMRHSDLFSSLERAGITVVSLQPSNIDQMYAYWLDLGKLTGRTKEAEAMIAHFKAGLAEIEKRFADIPENKRPRVYFEAIHEMMRTFAPDSSSLFCLKSAGGINIATNARPRNSTNIADYGKEQILSHANDIDVYLAQTGRMNRVDKMMIMEEPGFQAIKAINNGRVYLIDEQEVSRPTMRMLAGIKRLNEMLYPTDHHL